MSGTDNKLRALLQDDIKPNMLKEVGEILEYLDNGSQHGEVLFLSLGETWEFTPPRLMELLAEAPLEVHGYQLSMYGLPALRKKAAEYIMQTHKLTTISKLHKDYEVGITWTGTRSAMADFGRLLKEEYFVENPTIIHTAPGWDYTGVFEPLGYSSGVVELDQKVAFEPSLPDYDKLVSVLNLRQGLIVINAQHNPTARNWTPMFVRKLITFSLEKNFAILIDDAQFGLCHPGVEPTSALKILLEEMKKYTDHDAPWMAFRSFGKQFAINGWGIGMLTSSPPTLDQLANKYRLQHVYNYNGAQQFALSQWIDSEESMAFLRAQQERIFTNKHIIHLALVDMFGYDGEDIFVGECTNFILFSVPKSYINMERGVENFLHACRRYGIVLTDGFPKPYDDGRLTNSFAVVRVYVGASTQTIRELIRRLVKMGFHNEMEPQ